MYKNTNSVAATPLQFRLGMYKCDVFAIYTFWHKKYELRLTSDIGLLHMYHLSVLPPKQHEIPLIVSRQISIPNVSPNLTDAHIGMINCTSGDYMSIWPISRRAFITLSRGAFVV